ncbi:carbohydrate-binding protein [Actinomadura harenae]|uniref:Carbohydrate-binding protein n=1 Tax=Actinomadura harenae TaxID=2483351 RepID=A0A3M2L962_9ACTN|nr:carbohydrate-binding protein [Actinomadura harenae]RMI31078.1 carbohydrate-binding protein [Actinomadura harenae]
MQRRTLLACVLPTVLLTALAAAPATAAPDPTAPVPARPTAPASPDPTAPKIGHVAGARPVPHDARTAKAARAFRELHDARLGRTAPALREQVHEFWGVEPAAGTHDGIVATHSVDPSYQVSYSDDFTYAPTTKAASSCMEVTTVYSQAVGNELWAWDWCGSGGPAVEIPMDASFQRTYTTQVNGHAAYTVQLVRTNPSTNAWTAYLYNYTTGAWSSFFSKSGTDTSALSYGWDIFEIYASRDPSTGNAYYCQDAKNVVFESSSIKLRRNGAWVPASPSDSPWQPVATPNPSDYLCPTLTFTRAGANDHWLVGQ